MSSRRLGLAFLALSFLSLAAGKANAQFSYGGDHVSLVLRLPDTPEYRSEKAGAHFDIGYHFKQMAVIGLPLWNYDECYCLYFGPNSDKFARLTKSEAEELATKAELALPKPNIPFWDAWGGRLVMVVFIVGCLLYGSFRDPEASRLDLQRWNSFQNSALVGWAGKILMILLGGLALLIVGATVSAIMSNR